MSVPSRIKHAENMANVSTSLAVISVCVRMAFDLMETFVKVCWYKIFRILFNLVRLIHVVSCPVVPGSVVSCCLALCSVTLCRIILLVD